MTDKIYLETAYDYIDNGSGELMIVLDKPDGEADDENAKLIYNGNSRALITRNDTQMVRIYVIPDAVRGMLGKIQNILVTEMDGEEIGDVYEAEIVINNDESLYK